MHNIQFSKFIIIHVDIIVGIIAIGNYRLDLFGVTALTKCSVVCLVVRVYCFIIVTGGHNY